MKIIYQFSDLIKGEIAQAPIDDRTNLELGKSDTVKSNNTVNGSVEDTVNVSVTESVRSYNDKKNEAKDIPNSQSILQRKIIEYVEDSEEEYDDEEEEEEDEGNQVNGDDGSPKSTNFEFDVSN